MATKAGGISYASGYSNPYADTLRDLSARERGLTAGSVSSAATQAMTAQRQAAVQAAQTARNTERAIAAAATQGVTPAKDLTITPTNQYVSPYANRIASLLNQAVNYGDYESPYGDQISGLINQAANYGEYKSPYAERIESMLSQAENRAPYQSQYMGEIARLTQGLRDSSFDYSAETDPNYQAMRKTYEREARRNAADVLAQAAAATGGRASSYAVNAASQAGNYFRSQLADKQLDLFDSAYSRYLNEYQKQANLLQTLQGQDELAYNRWQDEYSSLVNNLGLLMNQDAAAYQRYGDSYNRLLQNLGVLQGQDETGYNRYQNGYTQVLQSLGAIQGQDANEYTRWNNSLQAQMTAAEAAASAKDKAYSNLVTAIATTGYSPSAEELAAAGMSKEEAAAWKGYYAQQLALTLGTGSGGGSGGYGSSGRSYGSSGGSSGGSVTAKLSSAEDPIAAAALTYLLANPDIAVDSRTLDGYLSQAGISGKDAQTFKSYYVAYGGKTQAEINQQRQTTMQSSGSSSGSSGSSGGSSTVKKATTQTKSDMQVAKADKAAASQALRKGTKIIQMAK